MRIDSSRVTAFGPTSFPQKSIQMARTFWWDTFLKTIVAACTLCTDLSRTYRTYSMIIPWPVFQDHNKGNADFCELCSISEAVAPCVAVVD